MSARRILPVLALAAAALLAACSATVAGTGHVTASRSPDFPSPSKFRVATQTYARTPASTRIGDPVTRDLCDLVNYGGLDTLQLTASDAEPQYEPGCDFRIVQDDDGALIYVELTADQSSPPLRGAAKRLESSIAVYAFGYDAKSGDCERVVAVDVNLWLEIHAFRSSAKAFPATTTCSEMDKVAKNAATGVVENQVQVRPLPDPSLSSLELCKAVSSLDRHGLPLLDRMSASDPSFGVRCELRSKTVQFYLQYVIAADEAPSYSTPVSVGGHRLFASSDNDSGNAVYTSVQQPLLDRSGYEEIEAGAIALDANHPPADLDSQTGEVLAGFLDVVNLH